MIIGFDNNLLLITPTDILGLFLRSKIDNITEDEVLKMYTPLINHGCNETLQFRANNEHDRPYFNLVKDKAWWFKI